MNIKASLRFLAIAGAFLSAKSALAHNSFAAVQTLVTRDTLKTQFLGVNNPADSTNVNDRALQDREPSQDIGNSQQAAPLPSVAIDRSQPNESLVNKHSTPVVERLPQTEIAATAHSQTPTPPLSSDEIGTQPTPINVFASDVATVGDKTQISSVPAQVEPPEFSVTILVPPPLTQIVKRQSVKKLPRFAKVKAIPVVAIPTSVPRTNVTPVSVTPTFAPRANMAQTSVTPTLAPKTTILPVVNIPRTSTPTTVTEPFVKPPAAVATSPDPANSDIIYPLLRPAPVTSRYGWRTHPLTGTRRFHSGIDIAAATGTPVVATGSGTVVSAGWKSGYGKVIVIQHDDDLQTLYGHLSEISVQAGQTLAQGTVIGKVGSTGNSTGPHLHFEKRAPNADGWVAVDPTEEIKYAIDNLRRSMPFAQKDLPEGL